MLKALALSTALLLCANATDIWDKKVHHAGALKNAMKKGDLTPKIELQELQSMKNLYALGAVGYLKGEVQIFDGASQTTYVKDKKVKFDYTYGRDSSLLVYAQVPQWVEYKIPANIVERTEFEEYLEELADKHGLDTEEAFPFLIEGTIKENSWHVIDWDPNEKIHTHQKHVESGVHSTMYDTPVKMLGFFSLYHSGIFTHHTTSMHIHFITADKKIAGHSDGMVLGKDMVVKLPKIK